MTVTVVWGLPDGITTELPVPSPQWIVTVPVNDPVKDTTPRAVMAWPTAAVRADTARVYVAGSLEAATNTPPVSDPNGAYSPSGAGNWLPVAPENTLTASAVPGPVPTTKSANSS